MIKSRLFVGIDVSHLLKDVIDMTSSTIECERNDIKWNTGTNLHITLLFLGDILDRGESALEIVIYILLLRVLL